MITIDHSNKTGRLKIAYNCRKATYLIEKKQLTEITTREQMELKIHLAGCSVCRLFEQQSQAINQMIRQLFTIEKMNEPFKNELRQRINAKLGDR